MSNTITVHVEFGPESRAVLDKILETLQGLRPNCHSCVETATRVMAENLVPTVAATAPQSAEEPAAPETAHPVEETPAPATPAPAEEPKRPKVTQADIVAMVQKLAAPGTGKKAQVKALVKEYAERVTLIPEDKFPEVMDKLTALAKEG